MSNKTKVLHSIGVYQLRVHPSIRIKPLGEPCYQIVNTLFDLVEAEYTSLGGAWDDLNIMAQEIDAIGKDIDGVAPLLQESPIDSPFISVVKEEREV